MKTAVIKDGKQQYIRVRRVKKIRKNQLHVYIADGINVEDTVMEKIKALCLVKNFYGIKENREVSNLERK